MFSQASVILFTGEWGRGCGIEGGVCPGSVSAWGGGGREERAAPSGQFIALQAIKVFQRTISAFDVNVANFVFRRCQHSQPCITFSSHMG